MYDELIKRLRRCEQFKCRECEYEQIMGCRAKLNAEAADAIEELCGLCASQSKDCSEAVAKYLDLWAKQPRWIPVTERLPDKFQSIFAACKSEGRENWTIDTVYDPFLECPWGPIPILEAGTAVVYAWMDNSTPEPPKEETCESD